MNEQQMTGETISLPDTVWNKVRDEVLQDFDARIVPIVVGRFLTRASVNSLDGLDSRRLARLNRTLEGGRLSEEQFVRRSVTVVDEAINVNPNATSYRILFDLDGTLLYELPSDEGGATILRSAAVPLLRELQNIDPHGRVSSGILTSRQQAYLDGALKNPKELEVIARYLDPESILSSSDASSDVRDTGPYFENIDVAIDVGSVQKVAACYAELQRRQGESLVLIDDQPGVRHVQSDEQFRALRLDSASDFAVLDPYR